MQGGSRPESSLLCSSYIQECAAFRNSKKCNHNRIISTLKRKILKTSPPTMTLKFGSKPPFRILSTLSTSFLFTSSKKSLWLDWNEQIMKIMVNYGTCEMVTNDCLVLFANVFGNLRRLKSNENTFAIELLWWAKFIQ